MTGAENLIMKGEFSIDDAGTVTGIAWPFNTVDTEGDSIEKGAFEFASDVPMVMEHQEGAVIGIWKSFKETDAGLEVTGRLFLEAIGPARDAYNKLRKGLLPGLSISGIVTKSRKLANGTRSIIGVIVNEISFCKHPVNPGARVVIVKSTDKETHMEPELINEPELKNDPVVSPDELKLLKARMDAIEAKASRLRGANNNNPVADNDNEEVKAFFDALRGDRIEKALSTTSGGVLIPNILMTKVIAKVLDQSPIRRFAQAITIDGPSIEVPSLSTDATIGEVTETSTRPESSPEFTSKFLRVFEMSVIVPITRQMLEDSAVSLESFFVNRMAQLYAAKEQNWFINGNGTSQAEGILTATEVTAPVTTAATTAITADELIDLFYALKAAYRDNGVWLAKSTTLAKIRKLKDTTGAYIWERSLSAGQPDTILGRPVFAADHLPDATAANTPILFGDFGAGYQILDRVRPTVEWDYQTGFGSGLVKGNTRCRVGGGVVNGEAIVKLKMKA